MARNILALSGWGQPQDALASVAPEATHIDYARHNKVEEALAAIAEAGRGCEAVIGWSLGGQLAVRAIASGMLKPTALVLIAAPFQFVETPELKLGMKRDQYEKFRDNYRRNPERTLAKAWELVVKDDTRAAYIREHLTGYDKREVLAKDWHHWLELLDGFSCAELDFSAFPATLLLHGDNDAVVGVAQSNHFACATPQSKQLLLNGCGHAPHWHDIARVKQAIAEHIGV